MKQRAKVRIVYKSGHVQDITANDFTVNKRGGDLTSVSWDDPQPKPMFFGIDSVESIYLMRGSDD